MSAAPEEMMQITEEKALKLCELIQSGEGSPLVGALAALGYIIANPNSTPDNIRRYLARNLSQFRLVFAIIMDVPADEFNMFFNQHVTASAERNLMVKKQIAVDLQRFDEFNERRYYAGEIESRRQPEANYEDEEARMKEQIGRSQDMFAGIPLSAVKWDFEQLAKRNMNGDTDVRRFMTEPKDEYNLDPHLYLLGPLLSPEDLYNRQVLSLRERLKNTNLFLWRDEIPKTVLPEKEMSLIEYDDGDVPMEEYDELEMY